MLRMAADNDAPADVRITALHTCVDQGHAAALPTARKIAAASRLMIPLRKAAIHTVGKFGTAEDVAFLAELAEADATQSAATQPAIKNLTRNP